MSVERGPRGVDAVVRELLSPLLHARPRPGGWRVLGWDCEQGVCVTVARGESVVMVELEALDLARDCYARTARFNVCARDRFGRPMDADARRAVDQLVAMVRAREAMLPLGAPRPEPTRGAMVREVEVDRALMPEGRGQYYLNPYSGCMIGCPFCYVAERADFSRALEGLPRLPWGRYVDVKVNAPTVVRREVTELPPGLVRMSPILTDPYQPLERRYRITRGCIEAMRDAGFTPMVLTRAKAVVDDVELLASFPRAYVGFSIPTDDDAVRARFEPGADPIDERIEALERCHAAGLVTFVVVQPTLPMDPERLAARVAPFVRAARVDRMHEVEQSRPLYEAAGLTEAMTEGFFARTVGALREAFAARGVPVDDRDDLGGLVQGVG